MESEGIPNIKIILMDVDGVLTDGKIYLGETEELKAFNVLDGMGISIAKRSGIKIGFLTGRESKSVERRAKELNCDFLYQNCKKKLQALNEILQSEQIESSQVCYIGDDINDIEVLRMVGFSATVNNAPRYVKEVVTYVSNLDSGKGAVREIIEHILGNNRINELISEG